MTPEIQAEIDNMSQYQMCYHWRFDAVGQSRYFNDPDIGSYFKKVWLEKGGMTPEISKELGWERVKS